MSTALLPVTLSMLCAGMAGIFLVLGILVLGVYALNKFFSGNKKASPNGEAQLTGAGIARPCFFIFYRFTPSPQTPRRPRRDRHGCRWWGQAGPPGRRSAGDSGACSGVPVQ